MNKPKTLQQVLAELREYECTGYTCKHETSEDHYIIEKQFIKQVYLSGARNQNTPMGVSQWKEHGKKYGYWKYFYDKAFRKGAKDHEAAVKVEKELHNHNSIPSYTDYVEEGCIICVNNLTLDEQSKLSKQFFEEVDHE